MEEKLRKQIISSFADHKNFKKLNKEVLFDELLHEFIHKNIEYADKNEYDKVIRSFYKFFTYFQVFKINRMKYVLR